MDLVEESVGGTKMTGVIQMVVKVQKQWFLGPLLPLSVNIIKIKNILKVTTSRHEVSKPVPLSKKVFIFCVGGMRNDDGDDGDDGKNEHGIKDVRSQLQLKADHNSRFLF